MAGGCGTFSLCSSLWTFFFFKAEDGIRVVAVTGVQTCALPISPALALNRHERQAQDVGVTPHATHEVARGRLGRAALLAIIVAVLSSGDADPEVRAVDVRVSIQVRPKCALTAPGDENSAVVGFDRLK